MNIESLNNIGVKIEAQSTQEREEILFSKIEQISLVFANHKYEEVKKLNKQYTFSAAVKEFSPIENIITRQVFHLENFNWQKNKDSINKFLDIFYEELDSLYESQGFDLDSITQLVDTKSASLKNYLEVSDLPDRKQENKITKILNFNKINNLTIDVDKKYEDLVKLGFAADEHYIEVHVEDFYKSGEKSFSSEILRQDFARLAEHIIDQEPETVAIIGESWLLSTPLAERLGFKKIETEASPQNNFSTWLQFIDQNGEIDNKRFNEFLKTSQVPYESVKAYMMTEDFLKKYLPAARRGTVVLKEINNEKRDYWARLRAEAESIKGDWSALLKSSGQLNNFIENNHALNDILKLVTGPQKKKYLDFLKVMYDNKIEWSSFYEHKNAEIEEIDAEINQAMHDDLYQRKEVHIE